MILSKPTPFDLRVVSNPIPLYFIFSETPSFYWQLLAKLPKSFNIFEHC